VGIPYLDYRNGHGCLDCDREETMKTWKLHWSPDGQCIATVQAKTMREAIRKAPMPYKKFLGEIYAEEQS